MTALDLLTDALAVYRLTRLTAQDELTERPRDWLVDRLTNRGHDKLAYLLSCPWCVSMYVGAGVLVLRRSCPKQWDPLARVLATSAATGIIASSLPQ